MTSPLARPPEEREQLAEWLLDRLTPAMSALGVIFVLVVLGEQLATPGSPAATALTAVGWALWTVFVAEFAARMLVAPSRSRFLRKNWWQLVFILLPVLRVLRLVRALRVLRSGRVLSAGIRASRSSAAVLRGRLGWLASLWVIVVLATSQLLHTFGAFDHYAASLHATALGAVNGQPLPAEGPFARVTEVFLAAVSVGLFGTIAGSLGAYFLHADQEAAAASTATATSPPR